VLARMIGQRMSEDWGQPVLIENRVGANTIIGAEAVQKASPDYTMLMAIDSTLGRAMERRLGVKIFGPSGY
jgi:tripartite-type tricarboxylate transporter receptor subunit TctC